MADPTVESVARDEVAKTIADLATRLAQADATASRLEAERDALKEQVRLLQAEDGKTWDEGVLHGQAVKEAELTAVRLTLQARTQEQQGADVTITALAKRINDLIADIEARDATARTLEGLLTARESHNDSLRADLQRCLNKLAERDATARVRQAQIEQLIAKWRAEGANIASFHATMGTGFNACAEELEKSLEKMAPAHRPDSHRPDPADPIIAATDFSDR